MSKSASGPSAFLLMPFNADLDRVRDELAGAASDVGVELFRADDIFESGIVVDQIRATIRESDAVLAVCTGRNPNVFFELGLADEFHKPILVAGTSDDLPFDVQHFRAQMYGGDRSRVDDLGSLRIRVSKAIVETLKARRVAAPPTEAQVFPYLPSVTRAVGFGGGTTRPFLQFAAWSSEQTPDPLNDDALEAAERWFKRSCPAAMPKHSSPTGLWWIAEDTDHGLTAWWLGTLEVGPYIRIDEQPSLHELPSTDADRGFGQPRAAIALADVVAWWTAQLAEAREFLETCGTEEASFAVALQTLPIQPYPRITAFDFGDLAIPERGADPDQVTVWSKQRGPVSVADLNSTTLIEPVKSLLAHFSYRRVERIVEALRLDHDEPPNPNFRGSA